MSEVPPKFDVTTPKNRSKALNWFNKHGWVTGFPWVYWKLGEWVVDELTDPAQREIELQRKAAVDIIRAGKENGADELEITMSDQAGIGLSGDVELPIQFNAGTQGTMTIKVKYK